MMPDGRCLELPIYGSIGEICAAGVRDGDMAIIDGFICDVVVDAEGILLLPITRA